MGSLATTIVLDVSRLAPDAVTIDLLARFQLAGRRHGQRLQLRGASRELRDLIAFAGLSDVLAVEPPRDASDV